VGFNRYFANCDAEQFIDDILINKLNVKHLVIGDDFHFGKARRGNFSMLKEKGKLYGFSVEDTGSYEVAGLRISSTIIRDALARVIWRKPRNVGPLLFGVWTGAHGDKRGRTIGYPTANIRMFRKNTPVNGVLPYMTGMMFGI